MSRTIKIATCPGLAASTYSGSSFHIAVSRSTLATPSNGKIFRSSLLGGDA